MARFGKWPFKDPDEVLDYQINWESRLGSDTIVDSEWIVPEGLTVDSTSHNATTTTIWLSGGTLDKTYNVQCRITTLGGRVMDQTVLLPIKTK